VPGLDDCCAEGTHRGGIPLIELRAAPAQARSLDAETVGMPVFRVAPVPPPPECRCSVLRAPMLRSLNVGLPCCGRRDAPPECRPSVLPAGKVVNRVGERTLWLRPP
jgi:hypothetical protein